MKSFSMNRRQFARTSLALGTTSLVASLSGCTSSDSLSAAVGQQMPYQGKLGVQLYTLRDAFEKDYKSTLNALANVGYKTLEFAGYFDHNPNDVKAYMDELGLSSHATHIRLSDMKDNFGSVMETAKTMGQTYLVLPWIAEDVRTLDGYKSIAELLNKRGEEARSAGMKTAYHNHEFEFETINGQVPYDILLSETDPDLVTMEIDLFWTRKANVDPLSYFNKHPGRFFGCHVKDMNNAGEMVSVGDGVIDFEKIFAKSKRAGLEHFFVEHDNPEDAIASVKKSFAYLSSL